MNKSNAVLLLFLALALTLLAGCGGSAAPNSPVPLTPAPLSANNLNLIFVVSEDLAYSAPGDINPNTANLTNQGLQRSLLMGTFLKQNVLGGSNVTSIYALEPMNTFANSKQLCRHGRPRDGSAVRHVESDHSLLSRLSPLSRQ